jgi:hypothetical protein
VRRVVLKDETLFTPLCIPRAGGGETELVDRIGTYGETSIATATTLFEIRTSDINAPAEGDTLEMDGTIYVIQGEPLRDGEPGESDVILNPIHFYYNHRTQIETFVPQPSSGGGEARLDVLLGDIGTAVAAERSLGGLAETLTWSAPEISVLEGEGQRLRGL